MATVQAACSATTLTYSDVVTTQPDGSEIISRTWTTTNAAGMSSSVVQTITLNSPQAPVLPNLTDISATNSVLLTVTNTATDPNAGNDTLSYQLINPPDGMTIDTNGVITWTPTVAQSPSTNLITTVVTAVVTNSTGTETISTTNTFTVIVIGPYDGPVQLVSAPVSQTVCPGSNVTFTVSATGSGLAYQWYQGTNLLSGQTDSSLTLTNVSGTNVATYTVVCGIEPACPRLFHVDAKNALPCNPIRSRRNKLLGHHLRWVGVEQGLVERVQRDTVVQARKPYLNPHGETAQAPAQCPSAKDQTQARSCGPRLYQTKTLRASVRLEVTRCGERSEAVCTLSPGAAL